MQVIIIGGGVGGLAAARGLLARGHTVEVYERSAALRTGGAALGLYANGLAALSAVGVSIADLGRRIDILEMADGAGRSAMPIDMAAVTEVLGHENRTVPRSALLRRLAEGLPSGVLRFGAGAVSVQGSSGNGAAPVRVEFADGSAAEGDAVIGADGIGSVVRDALPGLPPAKPSGWASWQALTPVPGAFTEGTVCRFVQGRDGNCGIMPAGDGLLQWWFDAPWDPEGPLPASPAGMLRARYAHWQDPQVAELLANARDGDLHPYPHYRHAVPRTWGEGPVTLLGDAAHAFPPMMAQGANQALEDAAALTWSLGGPDGPRGGTAAALRRYERARRPRAARASLISARPVNGPVVLPPSLAGSITPWAGRAFAASLASVSTVLAVEKRTRAAAR